MKRTIVRPAETSASVGVARPTSSTGSTRSHTLRDWILEALRDHGGAAGPVDVCKYIWLHYEDELCDSGDLFYTWQYDVRWAAQTLRDDGVLAKVDGDRRLPWSIA